MKPNRARGLIRLSMTLLVAAGILLLGSIKPSHAGSYRGDACGEGACGSANFDFSGPVRLTNVNLGVADTKCDKNDVYIRLRVYDGIGKKGYQDLDKHRNSKGCNSEISLRNRSHLNRRGYIKGVRVFVCVDDFRKDTCFSSHYIDNPNT